MKPKLRADLEIMTAETEGGPVAYVRDPDNLAVPGIPFEAGVVPLLQYLDGEHTVEDMQADLMRRGAGVVPKENLEHLVDALDSWLFLDNENVAEERQARADYLAVDTRPATHAGQAYPEDADGARAFLDEILATGSSAASPAPPIPASSWSGIRISRLIAPHIDLELGAEVYSAAHQRLAAAERPDVVVVLGVRHEVATRPFIACKKHFATPLGTVPCDTAFVEQLEERYGESLTEEEIAHRKEHSIEFQALWLARHWPENPPTMVPLLIGSFHDFLERGTPKGDDEVERFLAALSETIAKDGRNVLVLASVDFAHVGPVYDDPEGLDEAGEQALKKADQKMLEPIIEGDAEAFFESIAKEKNTRNVCGVAPIYLTLRLGEPEQAGELLSYSQGRIHPESGSVVSYGAVVYA